MNEKAEKEKRKAPLNQQHHRQSMTALYLAHQCYYIGDLKRTKLPKEYFQFAVLAHQSTGTASAHKEMCTVYVFLCFMSNFNQQAKLAPAASQLNRSHSRRTEKKRNRRSGASTVCFWPLCSDSSSIIISSSLAQTNPRLTLFPILLVTHSQLPLANLLLPGPRSPPWEQLLLLLLLFYSLTANTLAPSERLRAHKQMCLGTVCAHTHSIKPLKGRETKGESACKQQ